MRAVEFVTEGHGGDLDATADAVLDYVKRKHHDFRMDHAILMYPRWQLKKMPLRNLIIADYSDRDIDLDQVDLVKKEPERKINQSPIVVDHAGAIIDGNHRAFAAKELGMTHIPAWYPVDDLDENFADGKKPGRKGLSRRVGIPKKATLGQLEKIAKSSTGERRKMAQWQLNMRRGQAKKSK
jgi:hypothetical protein